MHKIVTLMFMILSEVFKVLTYNTSIRIIMHFQLIFEASFSVYLNFLTGDGIFTRDINFSFSDKSIH